MFGTYGAEKIQDTPQDYVQNNKTFNLTSKVERERRLFWLLNNKKTQHVM